jgi:hypothetical protein
MTEPTDTRASPKRSTPQAANLAARLKELRSLAGYHPFAGVQTTVAGTKPVNATEATLPSPGPNGELSWLGISRKVLS